MDQVKVRCDRCGAEIEGYDDQYGTSGFYRIGKGTGSWEKYANPGESIVCDDCMWKDARYIADYGRHRRQSEEEK